MNYIFKLKNIFKPKQTKGFTLIEVAVAVIIMSLAFSGFMAVIIMSRESEMVAKNNLIAAGLAKEAFDSVRYMRDYNYSQNNEPFLGLMNAPEEFWSDPYYFTIGFSFNSAAGLSPFYLAESANQTVQTAEFLRSDGDRYGYDNNNVSPTIFRRLVTSTYHEEVGQAPYLTITVQTYWKQDNKSNVYELTGILSDWH